MCRWGSLDRCNIGNDKRLEKILGLKIQLSSYENDSTLLSRIILGNFAVKSLILLP